MNNQRTKILVLAAFVGVMALACSTPEVNKVSNTASRNTSADPTTAAQAQPLDAVAMPTPLKNVTAADVEKLKWLEGTWRGMDGDKPFFERYEFEGSTLVVTGLKQDGTPDGEPGKFELKNGEFGKTESGNRSAASELNEKVVQFVPVPPDRGNMFRFENEGDHWNAILEWPARRDSPARQKVYRMEPWTPDK